MSEGMDRAVQLVGSLFLFALVVGLAYVTSRFIGGRLGWAGGGRRLMRVVEAAPLGRDRQLVLIEVAGTYFLVGSGPQGVSQLTPVSDPAALARIQQAAAAPPPGPPAAGEPGAPVQRLLALLRRSSAPGAAPFSAVLAAARRRPAPQGAAGPGADPGNGPEARTESGSGTGPGGDSEHLPEHPLEATIGRLRQLAREPNA